MFFDILKTFLRFAIVFVIFVVAFGLGFHLLLIDQPPFETVMKSLLKTFVMLTGEFEYENIVDKPSFPELTYAFFLAFLIIMAIIVGNLLIGNTSLLKLKRGHNTDQLLLFLYNRLGS